MAQNIVVLGSSNTDMILQLERIPRPGETLLGGKFTVAAGGKGANQAVAAARAGGYVTFLARVGNDSFGRQAVEGLQAEGINVAHVVVDPIAPSGVALIFVANDGENSIGVASGANANLAPADIDAARPCLARDGLLVMQLETPLPTVQHAAELAASAGLRTILNPAPAQALSDDLLQHIAILTPNETEAELLAGMAIADPDSAMRAASLLRDRGPQTVIVTLGAKGAAVVSPDFTGIVPAFPVVAVDTTAAGDVFNGALAVALSEGQTTQAAVRFASAAAALSTTRLGAQPSAPRREEIDGFLDSRG